MESTAKVGNDDVIKKAGIQPKKKNTRLMGVAMCEKREGSTRNWSGDGLTMYSVCANSGPANANCSLRTCSK